MNDGKLGAWPDSRIVSVLLKFGTALVACLMRFLHLWMYASASSVGDASCIYEAPESPVDRSEYRLSVGHSCDLLHLKAEAVFASSEAMLYLIC